ncbi:Beta-ureidopropionase [Geodia barretti]|uniref:Beta-ureidopropionase n=1 Tax=Geodia barretti TaxID=519541 RepID=A0AA35X168_GEOBA|nr:Beta-ureidopropionase [Geodia barretti]
MPRVVRAGLIQAGIGRDAPDDIQALRQRMLEKHVALIEEAANKGVEVLCLQELFTSPYFPAEQNDRWRQLAEPVPDGPTVRLMQDLARKHGMVTVVPVFEEEITGLFYNTAAVIDSDGTYLGKYRKNHLPHVAPGFWEKFYFRPGNLGRAALGLGGAEIVFNPSATVAGLSEYLWGLEQPAHAAANGYFLGAINRVGVEQPWEIGEFYGSSYFCNPKGQIVVQGSRDRDEVVVGDLDLDEISEVRNTWQFYRDRRPETYGGLTAP